ncbi:ATP-dependent DNA helicase PIF1-like [Aphis craccivora]|uniref:ATP-dependent DNA helicase PIF1-like n=1 Tax=Aphis craccivora TaxID=307492 RepID=A0A6G0Y5Y7_APHCR|nr:ATP-dependent DNA helicase PIF1-like [Aphis craccivora]
MVFVTLSAIRKHRIQFPLKVCFAMTINKSKGQSLSMAGIGLREECFSHGQFYVACFRVSTVSSLVILPKKEIPKNKNKGLK